MSASEAKVERRKAQAERDRLMDEKLRADYYDPGKRARRRRNVRRGFAITLVIMLLTSVLNWGVISGWGSVQIERITISGNDGANTSVLVYRPSNATDENPAPAVLMLHGGSGSGRNHESWAVEFARRGFVCVSPDLYGSGDSLGHYDDFPKSSNSLLGQAEIVYDYLESLPYVDADNIISSGHSLGGSTAIVLGSEHDAKGIISASGSPYNEKKYLGTKDRPDLQEAMLNYDGSIALLFGSYEFGMTAEKMPEDQGLYTIFRSFTGDEDMDYIEPDHVYGSIEDGHGIVLTHEQRIHEGAFVTPETIGDLMYYGQMMVDEVPNYLPEDDQVWMYKDYIGLFGIFSFIAFLCATALLLIEEVPVFARVRRPLARNCGFRGVGLVLATLVGIVAPWIVLKTGAFGLINQRDYTNLINLGFNMGNANQGFAIILGLTAICILGLIIYVLSERKKKGLKACDFGITPADYDENASKGQKAKAIGLMILATAGVAALTIAIGWTYVQFQTMWFGTDFYAWFFGIKDMPVYKIPYYIPYIIVFALCFTVLSLDMNVIRRLPTTGNETKDLIIAMAVNMVVATTAIILVVALKWGFETVGMIDADNSWFLTFTCDWGQIWGMPVGMGMAAAGSTFIYKKTGNIWLCALLNGVVACLMAMLYGATQFHF